MDFTFLFVIILMLLAVKTGLWLVAGALGIILLITSKSKILLLAAIIGIVVTFGSTVADFSTWVVVGGLFLILVILAKNDSDHPAPQGFYGGGY